jgi:hypothetical protein
VEIPLNFKRDTFDPALQLLRPERRHSREYVVTIVPGLLLAANDRPCRFNAPNIVEKTTPNNLETDITARRFMNPSWITSHNPFSDWRSVVSELKSENINGSVNETRSIPLMEYYTNLPSTLVRKNDRFVEPGIKLGRHCRFSGLLQVEFQPDKSRQIR